MGNDDSCNHSGHNRVHNTYFIYGSGYGSGKLSEADGAGIGMLFVIFGIVVIIGLVTM